MRNTCIIRVLSIFLILSLFLNYPISTYALTINGYEQDVEALAGVIEENSEVGTVSEGDLSFPEDPVNVDDSVTDIIEDSGSFSEDEADGSESVEDEQEDTSSCDSHVEELPDSSIEDSHVEELPDSFVEESNEDVLNESAVDSETEVVKDLSVIDSVISDDSSDITISLDTDEFSEDTQKTEETVKAAASLSGFYYIRTAGSTPKMMCVSQNSQEDAANIQLGTVISSNVRIFQITATTDGYYNIRSFHTGKYLTETINNVNQKKADSKNDQKWVISRSSDGTYNILTKDKKRYITVDSENPGDNIYTACAGKGLQKWSISKTQKLIYSGDISYSYPTEVSAVSNHTASLPDVKITAYGKVLKKDVDYTLNVTTNAGTGTILIQGTGDYSGKKSLSFKVADYLLEEGVFIIKRNGNNASMFSVSDNSKEDNAKIVMGAYACSNVRNFRFRRAEGGYYYIQNIYTGKYLTASGAAEYKGLVQKQLNKSDLQKWRLENKNGLFYIGLKNSDLYLSAFRDTKGTQVKLNRKGAAIQMWNISASRIYISGAMAKCVYDKEVSFNASTCAFNKPSVKLYINGTQIKKDTDYTLSYTTNIPNGKGTVTLKGIGKYTGKAVYSYTLKSSVTAVSSNAIKNPGLSGKKFIIHPALDKSRCVMAAGQYIKNGSALYSGANVSSVMSVFKFVSYSDGLKILGGNICYSIYAGAGGKNSATIQKQNDKANQKWNAVKNSDGTWSIINTVSGYALTVKETRIILLPYCRHQSQKFTLERVAEPSGSNQLPEVRTGVNTFISDSQYVLNFTLKSKNTAVYLTKEKYHKSYSLSTGIMCDMKNRKLAILKPFVEFNRNYSKSLAEVSFGDIIPREGEKYSLILKQENTMTFTAILKEVSTGKSISIRRTYGAGRGWGVLKTYVYGSVSDQKLRSYSLKPSDCDLVIMGDSYTEGASLGLNYTQRYSTLISKSLNGTTAIVCQGGATSADGLKWLKQYVLDVYHPKYMILGFGMNDSDYGIWLNNMKEMISILKKNNITPILMTVPPSTAQVAKFKLQHRNMSKWVINSGYRYLDFEYYMTKNHDRVTPDLSTFVSDKLHPTETVHKKIKNAFIRQMGGLLS